MPLAVSDLNARLLLGQDVDVVEHSQAISTMVRIATRIGLNRIAKPVPSLQEYLASLPKDNTTDADSVCEQTA